MFLIDDEEVHAAFDVLRSNKHAKARAAYEYAEKRLKVVLAKAELAANGKTVGERQASALASPEYESALRDFRLIADAYQTERDKREAAVAITEAWRTQRSDQRAMARVA